MCYINANKIKHLQSCLQKYDAHTEFTDDMIVLTEVICHDYVNTARHIIQCGKLNAAILTIEQPPGELVYVRA